jgi:SAM-dependent methyltransferase
MLRDGYRRLLGQQADPSRQVGWTDRLQQLLWFEMLAAVGNLCAPEGPSVLDVGCGLGDFLDYLRRLGFVGLYTGVDLVPEFVETARTRYVKSQHEFGPDVSFVVGDILDPELVLEPHDYVLASGLFDYRTPDIAERLPRTVRRLFDLCRRGVAWNMLNVAPDGRRDLYRAPPSELLALCDELTPWFIIRGDYDPHAFTFYLYKRDHFVDEALYQLVGRLYLDADARAQLLADPVRWATEYGLTLQQLNLLWPILQGEQVGGSTA